MKRKSLTSHLKWLGALVLVLMFSYNSLFAQCTVGNVTVDVNPKAPIQFQFFPISLLGIGGQNANLSAFQNFGVSLNNSGAQQNINVKIGLTSGTDQVFDVPLELTLSVPSGNFYLSVPELINRSFSSAVRVTQTNKKAHISQAFQDKVKGGLPSGTFSFTIDAAPGNFVYSCSQLITIQIATGSTVDLIIPGNGSTTQSLPQFQWAGTGGQKFVLTISKLKTNQSQEDALKTSSQRVVVNITGNTSYQTTAGGPISGGGVEPVENNLTWSPGLTDGEYCYRVTMVQEDPITGSQNLVNSQIASFTVASGATNVSGINTEELLNLLSGALGGVNIGDKLKGYLALSIEIDGKAATMDDLRTKLGDIKGKAIKVEIKP